MRGPWGVFCPHQLGWQPKRRPIYRHGHVSRGLKTAEADPLHSAQAKGPQALPRGSVHTASGMASGPGHQSLPGAEDQLTQAT